MTGLLTSSPLPAEEEDKHVASMKRGGIERREWSGIRGRTESGVGEACLSGYEPARRRFAAGDIACPKLCRNENPPLCHCDGAPHIPTV
jgi:hypothetical protein